MHNENLIQSFQRDIRANVLMHHNRNEPLTYPQEQLKYKYQTNSLSLNTYVTSLVSLLRGGVKNNHFSYGKKLRPPPRPSPF